MHVRRHGIDRVTPERRVHEVEDNEPGEQDGEDANATPLAAREEPCRDQRRPREPAGELRRAGEAREHSGCQSRARIRAQRRLRGPQQQPPRGQLAVECREMRLREKPREGEKRRDRDHGRDVTVHLLHPERDCRAGGAANRAMLPGELPSADAGTPRGALLRRDSGIAPQRMPFVPRDEMPVVVNDSRRKRVESSMLTAGVPRQPDPREHLIGSPKIFAFIPDDRHARGGERQDDEADDHGHARDTAWRLEPPKSRRQHRADVISPALKSVASDAEHSLTSISFPAGKQVDLEVAIGRHETERGEVGKALRFSGRMFRPSIRTIETPSSCRYRIERVRRGTRPAPRRARSSSRA